MIERCLEKLRQSKVDRIVVASPHGIEGVEVFVGDEHDVLKRFYDCVSLFKYEVIVRVTADCPMLDPEIIDYAIDYYFRKNYPYVYFAPVDGLDVEVFSYDLLKEAHENAVTKEDREHVTPYMKRKTKISVDTIEELEKVRNLWNG